MEKHQVPIPAVEPTEADNPPSEQTAQNKVVPAAHNDEWTTKRIITIARQQWQQLDWSLVWTILAVKGVIFVFGVQTHLLLMT